MYFCPMVVTVIFLFSSSFSKFPTVPILTASPVPPRVPLPLLLLVVLLVVRVLLVVVVAVRIPSVLFVRIVFRFDAS